MAWRSIGTLARHVLKQAEKKSRGSDMRAPAVTVSNGGGNRAPAPAGRSEPGGECDGGKGPFSTAQDDGKPAWALGGLALRFQDRGPVYIAPRTGKTVERTLEAGSRQRFAHLRFERVAGAVLVGELPQPRVNVIEPTPAANRRVMVQIIPAMTSNTPSARRAPDHSGVCRFVVLLVMGGHSSLACACA